MFDSVILNDGFRTSLRSSTYRSSLGLTISSQDLSVYSSSRTYIEFRGCDNISKLFHHSNFVKLFDQRRTRVRNWPTFSSKTAKNILRVDTLNEFVEMMNKSCENTARTVLVPQDNMGIIGADFERFASSC